MTIICVATNGYDIAFDIRGEINMSGKERLVGSVYSLDAEFISVIQGLNAYYLRWNNELDARQDLIDVEASRAMGETMFAKVSSVADRTKRPLPPAVIIKSSCATLISILHAKPPGLIKSLNKLLNNVMAMTKNVPVEFMWIPAKDNPAAKLLKE